MKSFTQIVIALALVTIILGTVEGKVETIHAKKCDKYCGVTSVVRSGNCKDCCTEKGFRMGGSCGDFMNRHCRCRNI